MKLRDQITGRLSWLWEWQQALYRFYSQSNLKVLVNDWSYTHAVPTLAYVCVEDVTFRGDTRK